MHGQICCGPFLFCTQQGESQERHILWLLCCLAIRELHKCSQSGFSILERPQHAPTLAALCQRACSIRKSALVLLMC